ncbi:MAG: lysophospholipid acyltransferase family protein [Gammaproteobacteria bacterium]
MLEQHEFLEKITSLQRAHTERMIADRSDRKNIDRNEENCTEFASANLRHLLPAIPITKHAKIINEILFTQARAVLDEDSCFLLESTKISDPGSMLLAAKENPVIFCTFHFGSYRLINQVLVSRGLNYILPVSSDIFATQKKRYEDGLKVLQAFFKTNSQLIVVNAEEPTTALTLARKTRAGWSLLAYIDGNTGVQGAGRRDSKTLSVPLLGKPIFARKGIAFISHFLDVPIVPVLCEITGPMQRTMTFHEKIDPSEFSKEREAYCQMATEKLYAVLAGYLKRLPGQWEGWLDMQKYLDMDGIADSQGTDEDSVETASPVEDIADSKLVFNRERFGFIIQEDGRALLDKDNYKLLSLPQNITDILEAYHEPAVAPSADTAQEQRDIVMQLVSMGMLSVVSQ